MLSTPEGSLQNLAFVNAQSGWVLLDPTSSASVHSKTSQGANSSQPPLTPWVILHTANSGETWQTQWTGEVASNQQGGTYLQVIDSTTAFVVAGGRLLGTENRGTSWTSLGPAGQQVESAEFSSSHAGLVVTIGKVQSDGSTQLTIWSTKDGGTHWTPRFKTPSGNWSNVELSQYASNTIVLAKDLNTFNTYSFVSHNNGQSWQTNLAPSMSGRVFPSKPVYESASTVLVAAGGGAGPLPSSFSLSTDGGLHFQTANGSVYWRTLWLSRAFGSVIYGGSTAGNGQQLLKSVDDGRSWRQVYPALLPTENVSFVSGTEGFGQGIATDPGAVLSTTDGGQSWHLTGQLPQGGQVTAFSFRNLQDGLAVVNQPRTPQLQVYQTTDGGQTWKLVTGALPSNTTPIIQQMGLINPATVIAFSTKDWMVGASGYPKLYTFHSVNSGASWGESAEANDPPGSLEDYAFASPEHGWMSMLLTPKSGVTTTATVMYRLDFANHVWNPAWTVPDGVSIAGIARNGLQDGWLVGLGGSPWTGTHEPFVVYRTTNGGQSWEKFVSSKAFPSMPPGPANVYEVSFPNAKDGWILTSEGLLHTTDGGQSWQWQQ